MFRSRTRTVVTVAVVLEGAIAGWALGGGWLGLLAMVAAVTIADTAWGIARRGAIADLAGLEVALALAIMIAVGAPGTHDRADGGGVRGLDYPRRATARPATAAAVRRRRVPCAGTRRSPRPPQAGEGADLLVQRRAAVERQERPSAIGEPSTCVIVPPASRTITSTAVVSHVRTIGSTMIWAAPRATSMCPQKSPSPRTRHADAESSR